MRVLFHLRDFPGMNMDHAVGHRGKGLVVRDDYDGPPGAAARLLQ